MNYHLGRLLNQALLKPLMFNECVSCTIWMNVVWRVQVIKEDLSVAGEHAHHVRCG